MEVDVSTIIGYVMKFNYALPYNASYLTDSYVRYDRSISPGVEVDGDDEPNPDYQGITTHLLSLSLSSFFHQLPAFLIFPPKNSLLPLRLSSSFLSSPLQRSSLLLFLPRIPNFGIQLERNLNTSFVEKINLTSKSSS